MATPHHLPKKRGALQSTPKISFLRATLLVSHNPFAFSATKNLASLLGVPVICPRYGSYRFLRATRLRDCPPSQDGDIIGMVHQTIVGIVSCPYTARNELKFSVFFFFFASFASLSRMPSNKNAIIGTIQLTLGTKTTDTFS